MAVNPDSGSDEPDEPTTGEPNSRDTEVQSSDDTEARDSGADGHDPPPRSAFRLALAYGLAIVAALAGVVGWLGYRTYESHQADEQRKLFLQVGRQGALNLTTIDYMEADADVQRILDSATGTFHDDFQKRSQPFIEVVKQAQSRSQGRVTEAGLESEDGDGAQVLVAVTVETSNAGEAEQRPRAWRMRIGVKKVGDSVMVSNVDFVP